MSTTASLCCVICAECYKSTDEILCTNCGHVFHKSCFEDWQMRSITCPDCRLNQPQTQRIYLHFEEHVDLEHKFMQTKLELSNKIFALEQQLQESEANLFDTLNVLSNKDDQVKKLLDEIEFFKTENESYKEELKAYRKNQYNGEIKKQLCDNVNDPNTITMQIEENIETQNTGAIKKQFCDNVNDSNTIQIEENIETQNTGAIKKQFCDNVNDSNTIQIEENIETQIEKPNTGAIKKQFFTALKDKVIDTNFNLSQLQISVKEPKDSLLHKLSNAFPYNINANPFLCTPPQASTASTNFAAKNFDSDCVPMKSIFVSRFALNTTAECIKYFVEEKLPDVKDISVKKFNTRPYRRVCSFRITVPENVYDIVLESSFWPSFVYVNEYVERHNYSTVAVLEQNDSPQIETSYD